MDLRVDDVAQTLARLRLARQTCQTRFVQLSTCRACGSNLPELEQTIALLKDLEHQLETAHVPPVAE